MSARIYWCWTDWGCFRCQQRRDGLVQMCGIPPALTDGSVAVSADRSSALFSCDTGYSLTGATSSTCVDGEWVGTLPTCTDMDECLSSPCFNGATCFNGKNTYKCSCVSGFTGSRCETDIDECLCSPCLHGGTCFNGLSTYTCSCASGFTGSNCGTDIDECLSSQCLNGATCINGINTYTCSCASGFTGLNCESASAAQDCKALRDSGVTANGVYTVQLWSSGIPIQVYCDMQTDGGGWTVFQNRYDGSVNFYRSFAEYENGFGNIGGEFWIGLKFVQEMAQLGPTVLRLDVSAADLTTFYNVYQNFHLGSGNSYTLYIGERSGSVSLYNNDPFYTLLYHNGSCFSTYDRECMGGSYATSWQGAWWFNNCFNVHLNGVYEIPGSNTCYGILDYGFRMCEALKTSKMMFRRV